jgi:hypothetical protein
MAAAPRLLLLLALLALGGGGRWAAAAASGLARGDPAPPTATHGAASATAAGSVEGRLALPSDVAGAALAEKFLGAVVTVRPEGGGPPLKAFCRRDGSFSLLGLPPGEHALSVYMLGFTFPEARGRAATRAGRRGRLAAVAQALAAAAAFPLTPLSRYPAPFPRAKSRCT